MERDRSFDALKFVLICLVVLGHVIEKDKYSDPDKSLLFSFIYTFHMPLFIFISGYFSKNMTWGKFTKSFKSLAVTYIVFQSLYSVWDVINGTFDPIDFLTVPCNVLWYLVCIIIWRFLFVFLSRINSPFSLIMVLSLITVFAIGFIGGVNNILMRVITFFPFFALGYYCVPGVVNKIHNLNKIYTTVALLVIFAIVYIINDNWFILSLFLSAPYDNFPDISTGIIQRILVYLLAVCASVCVINLSALLTDIFSKFGSRTLDIYLLHPFWVYYVYSTLVLDYWLKVEHSWLLADISASIAIVVICLYVARLKIMRALINPVGFFGKRKIRATT